MRTGLFYFFVISLHVLSVKALYGQGDVTVLREALQKLQQTSGYEKADISFTMLDVKTGKPLLLYHAALPLAPASTLKTITTAAVLFTKSPDFHYTTRVGFQGQIQNKQGKGILIIHASGDPSLGSDRFPTTLPTLKRQQLMDGLHHLGMNSFTGNVVVQTAGLQHEKINSHWLDEDIANYYGAALHAFNWRENKMDITLAPDSNGFKIWPLPEEVRQPGWRFASEVTHQDSAGAENVYAYFSPGDSDRYVLRGTIDKHLGPQVIWLANRNPELSFLLEIKKWLRDDMQWEETDDLPHGMEKDVCRWESPDLKELVYACNQKSINLYAEAFSFLLRQNDLKKSGEPDGLKKIITFIHTEAPGKDSVLLYDACGLAPDNRITTRLLATCLRQDTRKTRYPEFYASLPLINAIHMKSGYIGGTRAYAGYHTLPSGQKVCFAFILHGYTVTPRQARQDMFRILDSMKK